MNSKKTKVATIKTAISENKFNAYTILQLIGITSDQNMIFSNIKQITMCFGAILVAAAIITYVNICMLQLSLLLKLSITLIPGISCYIILCLLLLKNKFLNFITPVNIISVCLQFAGLIVYVNQLHHEYNHYFVLSVIISIILLQQACLWWLFCRPNFGFFSFVTAILLFLIILEYLDINGAFSAFLTGSMILTGCILLRNTKQKIIIEFWNFCGSIIFLSSPTYYISQNKLLDLLVFLTSCFLICLSVVVKSKTIFYVAISAILSFIYYFTSRYYIQILGNSLCLVTIFGISICCLIIAIKIKNKYFNYTH